MKKIIGAVALGIVGLSTIAVSTNVSADELSSKSYLPANVELNSSQRVVKNAETRAATTSYKLLNTEKYNLETEGWDGNRADYSINTDNDTIPGYYKTSKFYYLIVANDDVESWGLGSYDKTSDFSINSQLSSIINNRDYKIVSGNFSSISVTYTSGSASGSCDVYVLQKYDNVGATHYANSLLEVNGDGFLDSINWSSTSYDYSGVYYRALDGTSQQDKNVVSFLNSLDEPVIVGIDSNADRVEESDFLIYRREELANKVLSNNGYYVDISSIYNSYEFIGIYNPDYNSSSDFAFGLGMADDYGEEPEISGISFYSISEIDVQKPTITGTNNFIVNINNPLSLDEILSHVSAVDETDGPVEVYFDSCDYDPIDAQLGAYDAVIAAQDKAGNEATYDIVIHVVDIDKPVYQSGQLSYTTNYKTQIPLDTIKNALKFTDNVDSEFTLNVTSDTYTASYNKVGQYQVKVTATDKSDNVSNEVVVMINVVDDIKPTINGESTIQANSDTKLSESQILEHFTASDEYCTTATLSIENYNDYANKYNVVGDYQLTIKATDTYGNYSTKSVTIHVNDKNKPTFTGGTQSYDVSYDAPISLDTIKGALNFSDDVDDELTITVTSDGYTAHSGEVGSYQVKVTATDKSGNVSDEVVVTINVYDHKAPVISAPGTVEAGNNKLVTLEEIKDRISITDGLDGTITEYTIEGYENYQAKYNVVGTYQLTIKASDKSGNQATATITVNVTDKISPEITFDNYFVILQEGEELSREQIISMASKVLGINAEAIAEVSGEYNTNEVGTYTLSVRTITNDVYTFTLNVEAAPEIVEYRNLEWYEYIYVWFTILFNLQDGYKTESFWNFSTRWSYLVQVYSSGQIKVANEQTDSFVNVSVNNYTKISAEQADMQSNYFLKGHIYLIPKGVYENDGSDAVIITNCVRFEQRDGDNSLNDLLNTDWDAVLVLEDSAPMDMMFTIAATDYYEVDTSRTNYTLNDFNM